MIKIADIDPKLSEKYSPNLFKWLRKWDLAIDKDGNIQVGVYRNLNHLYIGHLINGDFIGSRMSRVLCNGSKERIWSSEGFDFEEVPGFWQDYKEIGRCAIDKDHEIYFIGDKDRYRETEDGKSRQCQWCGELQHRHDVTVVKTRTEWASASRMEEIEKIDGLAQEAFESYDFGQGVEIVATGSGWDRDDSCDHIKRVYVRYDDDPTGSDSHVLVFHVRFEGGKVNEAYALDLKTGNKIGSMPVRNSARPAV